MTPDPFLVRGLGLGTRLQTRYQSTPLYLYIQNIKLVCDSGTLCAGLERENLLYTQPNINSMVNRLSFFKPTRPKLLQIGQTRYQSTPLYLYIQNIKLVCDSGTLCAGLERGNKIPKPAQIEQTGYYCIRLDLPI